MLSTTAKKLIGEPIDAIISHAVDPVSGDADTSVITTENDRKIVCTTTRIGDGRSLHILRDVTRVQRFEQKLRRQLSKKGHVAKYCFDDIIGESRPLLEAKLTAQELADNDLTVLLTGESGTGKEMFAQAMHQASPRQKGPFLAINFAALPENLIESELFGYEEGAFTGARRGGKQGIFELAHGGTIFLDEIGDAPIHIQAHLLRVLQEREIMRVGGAELIPIDIRVIAATNKALESCVENGTFRHDLYYRLNVLPIEIPKLSDRSGDALIILTRYLHQSFGETKSLDADVVAKINSYGWPGNVRELLNAASYMHILTRGRSRITMADLPAYLRNETVAALPRVADFLRVEGLLDDAKTLLGFLAQNRHETIGRSRMRMHFENDERHLTDYQMKVLIKKLHAHQLLTVGTTKQGTSITAEGLALLTYLEQHSPDLSQT
jgi:transcriptional regulator with PAS, ATPase and Fis domain